jgi:hypothetical protein
LAIPQNNVQFPENLVAYLEDLESVERVAVLPDGAYRFPLEAGQPDFVWADEQGATGVIRNCADSLYISLNWRHGFTDNVAAAANVRVNNLARIHLTRDAYDRLATIVMDSPSGFGRFYTARFGPYLIGMNLSSDSSYELPSFAPATTAFELVQRRPTAGTATVVVPPGETRVLYRQSH